MKFETKNKDIIYCKNNSYQKKYDNGGFYNNNRMQYYKGYLLHRKNKVAIEWSDGVKHWYLNGVTHREDGPAIEWSDGSRSWILNGRHYTEEEYWNVINLKNKKKILDEI